MNKLLQVDDSMGLEAIRSDDAFPLPHRTKLGKGAAKQVQNL